MDKHKPEWSSGKLGNDANQHYVSDGNGQTLAVTYDDPDGRRAALIAAAPDLLEALRECITEDGSCCMNTGQKSRRLAAIDAIARAAIAKAEGGAA